LINNDPLKIDDKIDMWNYLTKRLNSSNLGLKAQPFALSVIARSRHGYIFDDISHNISKF